MKRIQLYVAGIVRRADPGGGRADGQRLLLPVGAGPQEPQRASTSDDSPTADARRPRPATTPPMTRTTTVAGSEAATAPTTGPPTTPATTTAATATAAVTTTRVRAATTTTPAPAPRAAARVAAGTTAPARARAAAPVAAVPTTGRTTTPATTTARTPAVTTAVTTPVAMTAATTVVRTTVDPVATDPTTDLQSDADSSATPLAGESSASNDPPHDDQAQEVAWRTVASPDREAVEDAPLSVRRVVAQLALGIVVVLAVVTVGGSFAARKLAEREAVNDAANTRRRLRRDGHPARAHRPAGRRARRPRARPSTSWSTPRCWVRLRGARQAVDPRRQGRLRRRARAGRPDLRARRRPAGGPGRPETRADISHLDRDENTLDRAGRRQAGRGLPAGVDATPGRRCSSRSMRRTTRSASAPASCGAVSPA